MRAGLAPYVAGSGDFHSWLILQYENNSAMRERDSLTPLFRGFYKNVLFEAGYSFNNEFNFTLMIHL